MLRPFRCVFTKKETKERRTRLGADSVVRTFRTGTTGSGSVSGSCEVRIFFRRALFVGIVVRGRLFGRHTAPCPGDISEAETRRLSKQPTATTYHRRTQGSAGSFSQIYSVTTICFDKIRQSSKYRSHCDVKTGCLKRHTHTHTEERADAHVAAAPAACWRRRQGESTKGLGERL